MAAAIAFTWSAPLGSVLLRCRGDNDINVLRTVVTIWAGLRMNFGHVGR
jgi:hypothetical protein